MCLSQAVPISYYNWQEFNYQSYRESPTRPTARPQKWAYYQAAPSSRTAASPQFRPRTKVRTDAQFMNQQGWPQNFAHNSHPRFNPTFPPRSSMRPPTYPPATYPPATYPPTNPPTSYNSVPPPGSQSVTPPSRQLTASTPNVSLNTTRLGPEIKIIPTEQPRRIQPYSLVPVVTSLPRVTVVTSPTFSVVTSPTNLVVKSSIIPLVVSSSDSVVTKSSQTVPSVGVSKFSNTATDYHKQDKDKPNPCASSQCGPHANCSPFLETYMCSCTAGYTGAPPSIPCEPIDHCSQAVSPCGTTTVCNSTQATFASALPDTLP